MTAVDIHASLNAAQRAAATHGEPHAGGGVDAGPLLVIAGAGTGKTGTLAHRGAPSPPPLTSLMRWMRPA